ncbi:LrgB family protein [Ornithinibacillus salinisoli]|uniref:LrgB family protein n=1 Tax=Ornithinibacillus salinisoli TaxID=1848459 RepID=A0ABW4W177_9BACI
MWLILTLIVFAVAQYVYLRKKRNYLIPVFTATVVLIILVLISGKTYADYYVSAQWIDWLLGPAVVALSFPLYKHRKMLAQNGLKIVSWVVIAAILGVLTGAVFLWAFQVDNSYVVSAMLKNITAPVAIDLAEFYGGIPALTAVICTMSGMLGAVIGPTIFKKLNIKSSLAKAVAMGSTSHAIGTARLMEDDDYAGAISTLSFLLMTLVMPVLVPLFVYLLVG